MPPIDTPAVTTHHIVPTPRRPVAFRLLSLRHYLDKHQQFGQHRHGFFELMFVQTGSGQHLIDFVAYPVTNRTVFLISPGQVHSMEEGQVEAGFVLIFDRDYVMQYPPDADRLMQVVLLTLQRPHIHLSEADALHFRHSETLLHHELAQPRPDYDLVRAVLSILLIKALRAGSAETSMPTAEGDRRKKLFVEFLWLIETAYTRHHSLPHYADQLRITTKYLADLARQFTSRSALELIHDRLLTEAKRLLFHSELSVKEIADQLGFADASYFSRFFGQKAGVSPTGFQQSKRQTVHPKRTR